MFLNLWSFLTASVINVYNYFIPPQLFSVLQWIANDWTSVWNFDGTNIVDTETILGTGDFSLEMNNVTPTATDGWWWNQYVDQFEVGRFRVELVSQTSTTFLISIQIGEVLHTCTYTFEINKKYDSISINRVGATINLLINGVIVDTTTNATAISQATNLLIGSTATIIGTELTRYASLLAENFKINDETFTAPSLTGSQGTIAVATDPNGTLNDLEYSPNLIETYPDLYALKQTTPVVVDVGVSDRAVGNFDSDHIQFNGSEVSVSSKTTWDMEINFIVDDITTDEIILYSENIGGEPYFDIGTVIPNDTRLLLAWREGGGRYITFSNFFTGSVGVPTNLKIVVTALDVTVYKNGVLFDTQTAVSPNATNADLTYLSFFRPSEPRRITGVMYDVCINSELFKIDEGTGGLVTGSLGTIGTISDGTPNTFWDKGITYPINLNPTANALLTAKGILDLYNSRVDIDGLISNTIITKPIQANVVEPDPDFIFTYADGMTTPLTQDELDTLYKRVGRGL